MPGRPWASLPIGKPGATPGSARRRAADWAAELRAALRPRYGGRPRSTRSRSAATNSCCCVVREYQLVGRTIGRTPSIARALLIAWRTYCVQPGSLENVGQLDWALTQGFA